ncbi:DUF4870 domain-containing protein [Anaerocolumna sp.]|uniref:DUF4870 domain-containing protein n=1 Tax=Anaerocolumna sp. TaxID=2041569 RepID=UPI0028A789B9|nr:zinc-ribbon domain-containing protein [Anaerocolumna sp.]
MYCKYCGKEINDDANFCDGCGGEVQGDTMNKQTAENENINKGNDNISSTGKVKKDSSNKVIFILSYLGILFFLPLVVCPESKTGRFHANQGLVLLITGFAGHFILSILFSILSWRLWGLISLLFTLWGLVLLALIVIGMINAGRGEEKPLPVIGGIQIIK